jgi:hypothetical protein
MDDIERLFNHRRTSHHPAVLTVAEQPNKDKRGQSREREILYGNSLLELARDLNGTRDGISNKTNKPLNQYFDKKPNIRKRDIEKQCKDMCGMLSIVKPQIFKELVTFGNQENGV